ncbi:hypothetical protein [Abyssisolibacter fermentans]|uniref:hypothetical protein n=1 Tax=Abyssisolibacter fermentans TaxID=1766203 RepID=UPI00082F0D43|nr:hypothetical protein [Abyssisolibacter fermentans]
MTFFNDGSGLDILVIFEGFDRTGKTSLAQYIARELGFRYKHNMPSYNCKLYKDLIKQIQILKSNTVIDRFHLTELVCGKIVCNHVRLSDSHIKMIEDCLKQHNVVFVHCYADTEDVKMRYKKELNKYVPIELINSCLNEYSNLFNELNERGFKVYESNSSLPMDLQLQNVQKLIKDLKMMLTEEEGIR